MPKKYNLSNQEYTIMQLLWKLGEEQTLAEITELLQSQGFKPAIGTIKTYLQRLVKKGALKTRKNGHKLLYSPVTNETGYKQQWTQGILNECFGGSLSAFVCALTGNDSLTEEERKVLMDLYDE